jgi:uncharacterized protein
MKTEIEGKKLTIFINSTDQWHGRALYSAIVQVCKDKGIAGATVSRCEEGYGHGGHLHTTRLLELSANLPVRVEIIDVREKIEPLLAALEGMIGEGLVTVTDVHIIRYLPDPKS